MRIKNIQYVQFIPIDLHIRDTSLMITRALRKEKKVWRGRGKYLHLNWCDEGEWWTIQGSKNRDTLINIIVN